MKFLFTLLVSLLFFFSTFEVFAAPLISVSTSSIGMQNDINLRNPNIGDTGVGPDSQLEAFVWPVKDFFFTPEVTGGSGILAAFTSIAFQVKNFFIAIAILFLILAIIKLLFSPGDDEAVKKWKSNIIWVSVGIFVMQSAFSFWNLMIIKDSTVYIGSSFGFQIWQNLFAPIVRLLQMLASFGFLMMAVYAFYTIIAWAGDEEKLKKWKNTIIYGLVGFFLIKIPESLVSALYGSPNCKNSGLFSIGTCEIKSQDLSGAVGIIAKIINYFNSFLTVLCVLLVIYAGWQVLISWGDEEKLKKAKHTVLYIFIGFTILVASHAIFRFFILKG